MKLHPCGCGDAHYVRAPREWWMRIASDRRLFICSKCEKRLFLQTADVAPEARHRFQANELVVPVAPAPAAKEPVD